MNMFGNARQRNVPTSVGDCVKEDRVTANLWTWAGRLETLGKVLFVLIIVFGIYSSYQLANQTYEVDNSFNLKPSK